MTNGCAGAADGTLETRWYINQNWRGDVAVVTDDVGIIQERVKYSAYGVPTCLASADYDGNGTVNSTDDTKFQADLTALDPLSDFNFDGATDFFDYLDFTAAYSTQLGSSNGRGVLSRSAVGNRFGYAGYQWDPAIAGAAVIGGKWHVRHRVLDAERGTWLTRDPLGYHDGEDLYEYVKGGPVKRRDPSGLCASNLCANQLLVNSPGGFLPDPADHRNCEQRCSHICQSLYLPSFIPDIKPIIITPSSGNRPNSFVPPRLPPDSHDPVELPHPDWNELYTACFAGCSNACRGTIDSDLCQNRCRDVSPIPEIRDACRQGCSHWRDLTLPGPVDNYQRQYCLTACEVGKHIEMRRCAITFMQCKEGLMFVCEALGLDQQECSRRYEEEFRGCFNSRSQCESNASIVAEECKAACPRAN